MVLRTNPTTQGTEKMTDATYRIDDLAARYDDALTRLLQERKRFEGLRNIGFTELAALKEAAMPHLRRIVDLRLPATGIDVERFWDLVLDAVGRL